MPRARVTAARLAQVVCDSSGTRHARRRTYGGDPQLELVTIEAVEHRKIGHASARAEICSGIVVVQTACLRVRMSLHALRDSATVKRGYRYGFTSVFCGVANARIISKDRLKWFSF